MEFRFLDLAPWTHGANLCPGTHWCDPPRFVQPLCVVLQRDNGVDHIRSMSKPICACACHQSLVPLPRKQSRPSRGLGDTSPPPLRQSRRAPPGSLWPPDVGHVAAGTAG
eukprot:4577674-Amphidinium_carterae.2